MKIINLEEEFFDDNLYDMFLNRIHLYKEVGVFSYYKNILENPTLILQINELFFNNINFIFKRINQKEKIYITLNNSNYYNDFYYTTNENLMKIKDNKFSYVYYNLDIYENYHFIVLIIFDLYGNNNENLSAKYYTISLSSFSINNGNFSE